MAGTVVFGTEGRWLRDQGGKSNRRAALTRDIAGRLRSLILRNMVIIVDTCHAYVLLHVTARVVNSWPDSYIAIHTA